MQRNWIGKKEGINITYKVVTSSSDALPKSSRVNSSNVTSDSNRNSRDFVNASSVATITCFTTAPVNFGMTFIVVAPEHPLVKKIMDGKIKVSEVERKNVTEYYEKSIKKSDMDRQAEGREKTGVFTGLYATNQVAGWDVPVWVSDFVVGHVGTGAVQGCPGHDYKDFEFAKKFNLPIIRVVEGKNGDRSPIERADQVIVKGMKGKMMNSKFLDGLDFAEGLEKTMDYIEKNNWGKRVASYHLRDWIFSRQRYWGEPIPMVYCESCAKSGSSWWTTDEGKTFQKEHQNISKVDQTIQKEMGGWFPLVEQDLPLKLPYVKSYEPTDTGESPLSAIDSFKNTICPNCGGLAIAETDTMPNWAGSCWYFLKFASPDVNASTTISSRDQLVSSKGGPVASRSASQSEESLQSNLTQTTDSGRNIAPASQPWKKEDMDTWMPVDWYLGGAEHAVLHLLYARFWVKALQDLGLLNFSEPFLRLRNVGMVLAEDHRKMSKSYGNVINPDDVVAEYGADALRIYEMFMAPFNMEISWSTKALQGGYRFLNRIWQLYHNPEKVNGRDKDSEVKKIVTSLHKTIKKVEGDISQTKYNTAIAAMMELLNEWEKGSVGLPSSEAKKFLQILSPFAPFIAEHLWREIYKEKTSICISSWPAVDEKQLIASEIQLPVQVAGKVRGVLTVSASAPKEEVEKQALKDEKIKKHIGGKKYSLIYVPGKILNFVIKG